MSLLDKFFAFPGPPGEPGAPGAAPAALQEGYAFIEENTQNVGGWADLLSVTLAGTVAGHKLVVIASVSCGCSAAGPDAALFRVLVDGAEVYGGGFAANLGAPGLAGTAAIVKRIPIAAGGSHTVKIQWAATAPGVTVHVNPTASLSGSGSAEHGSLYVAEIL